MLRELGEHPRRENRTGNLVHYMHKLTYQEQTLLAETITANGKRAVHVGMLPFLNRDQVVEILHEEIFNKNRNSWWDSAGIDPEISGWENKDTVTQTLKSKEKLVSRMVKHHLARSR